LPLRLIVSEFAGQAPLAAPHLIDTEAGHLLRRQALPARVSAQRARMAPDDHLALPLLRHGRQALLPRTFTLRANATIYDALYPALAEALEAPLLTRDARLARIPGIATHVEVVADGA
jgi:predicted nucleic acid-binding protein